MYGIGAYGVSPFGFVIAFPASINIPLHKIPIIKVTDQDINVNYVRSLNENAAEISCVRMNNIGVINVMSPD
jgi:hypothetical protein